MKKKQFALGSLLLGAASWLCLWGLQHIERRMKKKQKKYTTKFFRRRFRRTGIVLYSASALLFLVVKIADQLVKQLNFLLHVSVQHNAR